MRFMRRILPDAPRGWQARREAPRALPSGFVGRDDALALEGLGEAAPETVLPLVPEQSDPGAGGAPGVFAAADELAVGADFVGRARGGDLDLRAEKLGEDVVREAEDLDLLAERGGEDAALARRATLW